MICVYIFCLKLYLYMRKKESWNLVNMIQQKLMIKLLGALVGVLVKIHMIGNFQMHPTILLVNGEDSGPEVQDQRTHIPMSGRSGLLKIPNRGEGTAETSFIEGETSGRVMTADSLRIRTAHEIVQHDYPRYGKDGKLLTLEVKEGKVLFVGPRGGRYPLSSKLMGKQLTQSYQKKL